MPRIDLFFCGSSRSQLACLEHHILGQRVSPSALRASPLCHTMPGVPRLPNGAASALSAQPRRPCRSLPCPGSVAVAQLFPFMEEMVWEQSLSAGLCPVLGVAVGAPFPGCRRCLILLAGCFPPLALCCAGSLFSQRPRPKRGQRQPVFWDSAPVFKVSPRIPRLAQLRRGPVHTAGSHNKPTLITRGFGAPSGAGDPREPLILGPA